MKKVDKKRKGLLKKYKGSSFADAVKRLEKKYPDREVDRVQRSTFRLALNMLKRNQEAKRIALAQQADEFINEKEDIDDMVTQPVGVQNSQQTPANFDMQQRGLMQAMQSVRRMPQGDVQQYETGGTISPLPTLKPRVKPFGIGLFDTSINTTPADMRLGNLAYANTKKFESSFDPEKQDPARLANPLRDKGSKVVDYLKDNIYAPAFAGQLINTAINVGLLSEGYDRYAPIENPYKNDILNTIDKSRLSMAALRNRIAGSFNRYREGLDNVKSSSVRRGLEANLAAQESKAMVDTQLKENQYNATINQQLASALGTLGAQDIQARERARQLTMQTKANYQTGLSQLGASISDSLMGITDIKASNMQQRLVANILDKKFRTFGIDQDTLNRALNGDAKALELIALKTGVDKDALPGFLEFYEKSKQKGNK